MSSLIYSLAAANVERAPRDNTGDACEKDTAEL